MSTRPTYTDLVAWLGFTPVPGSADATVAQDVLDAALEDFESHAKPDAIPDDANEYPARLRNAILKKAQRDYQRRNAPTGNAGGFGGIGPVPVSDNDADLYLYAADYLRLDGFA
jgi:hypothetical protein